MILKILSIQVYLLKLSDLKCTCIYKNLKSTKTIMTDLIQCTLVRPIYFFTIASYCI